MTRCSSGHTMWHDETCQEGDVRPLAKQEFHHGSSCKIRKVKKADRSQLSSFVPSKRQGDLLPILRMGTPRTESHTSSEPN